MVTVPSWLPVLFAALGFVAGTVATAIALLGPWWGTGRGTHGHTSGQEHEHTDTPQPPAAPPARGSADTGQTGLGGCIDCDPYDYGWPPEIEQDQPPLDTLRTALGDPEPNWPAWLDGTGVIPPRQGHGARYTGRRRRL